MTNTHFHPAKIRTCASDRFFTIDFLYKSCKLQKLGMLGTHETALMSSLYTLGLPLAMRLQSGPHLGVDISVSQSQAKKIREGVTKEIPN